MRTIDIRDDAKEVGKIIFANAPEPGENDVAFRIGVPKVSGPLIYIDSDGRVMSLRRKDVGNFIAALQTAKEIWEGCE